MGRIDNLGGATDERRRRRRTAAVAAAAEERGGNFPRALHSRHCRRRRHRRRRRCRPRPSRPSRPCPMASAAASAAAIGSSKEPIIFRQRSRRARSPARQPATAAPPAFLPAHGVQTPIGPIVNQTGRQHMVTRWLLPSRQINSSVAFFYLPPLPSQIDPIQMPALPIPHRDMPTDATPEGP